MKKLLFKFYRLAVWPFLRSECRFYPSCSKYSEEAISNMGWIKGMQLTVLRLFKCHPLHAGGYDPVPKK